MQISKTLSSDEPTQRFLKRTKRITWSALAGLFSSGAVALVSIFSAPITINYLGKDLYGVWVIITSFMVWAQLFDFGIMNGVTNALAEAFGRDDYAAAQSYICTSFFVTVLVSSIGLGFWIVGSLHVPWPYFIRVDTVEQEALLGKGICIVGSFFLLTLPFLLAQRILLANQKMYISHGVNFVSYVLSLLSLIIGVHYRFDLIPLLFTTSIAPLVCHVFCWSILTKKAVWARFSLKYVHFKALKRVAYSSVPLLIIQCINIITSQMIPLLLASVTTLKEVADFSILWKMYLFIFFMMASISGAHYPGFRDAYERGEIDWIKKSLKRLVLIQVGLIITGCSPLLILGNRIIETWIRMPLEQPLELSSWLIFTLCILFSVLNCSVSGVLVFLDKIKLQIVLSLLSSLALFIGIMSCVSKWGLITVFGVIGLSTLISLIYSVRALKRVLNSKHEEGISVTAVC